MTYLQDRSLTPDQLAEVESEMEPLPVGREDLLRILDRSLRQAVGVVREIDRASLEAPRFVGRKRLPTTVIGLLTHIAEHTQRHVGQAITMAKWIERQ